MMKRLGKALGVVALVALVAACAHSPSPAPSFGPVQDEVTAIVIAQHHQCAIPPIPGAQWHARLHPDGWYTWYGDDPPHAPALFIFVSQQDGRPGQCFYSLNKGPDSVDFGAAPLGPDVPLY